MIQHLPEETQILKSDYSKEIEYAKQMDDLRIETKEQATFYTAYRYEFLQKAYDLGLKPYFTDYTLSEQYKVFNKYIITSNFKFRMLGSNVWFDGGLEKLLDYVYVIEGFLPDDISYNPKPESLNLYPQLDPDNTFNLTGYVENGLKPYEYILFGHILYDKKSNRWKNLKSKNKTWYKAYSLKYLLNNLVSNDRFNKLPEDYKTWFKFRHLPQ
ncbi:hypothetical protein ACPF31_003483 [Vibrio cholerae]